MFKNVDKNVVPLIKEKSMNTSVGNTYIKDGKIVAILLTLKEIIHIIIEKNLS